jgi:hypothetical protein
MNTKFKMRYLSGGDDTFGPNYGGAARSYLLSLMIPRIVRLPSLPGSIP